MKAGSTLSLVALGGLLLSSGAVYNGAMLTYPDSAAYLGMAIDGWFHWGRPFYYSYLIYPLHWETTLWPVVYVQSLVVAYLAYLVLRATLGGVGAATYLGALAALTALTALPWVTGYLMADVFAPVTILALFLVALARDRLSRSERLGVAALAVTGMVTHHSHLPIGFAVGAAALAIAPALSGRAAARAALRPVAAVLLTATALAIAGNVRSNGWRHPFGLGSIFALARFLEDGPALAYLRDACPEAGFALCAHLEELGVASPVFLWHEESPIQQLGGFRPFADEAGAIVWGSLRARPRAHLENALRHAGRVLVALDPHPGRRAYPPNGLALGKVAGYVPADRDALYGSRQHRGVLPLARLAPLHEGAMAVAVLLCLGCAVPLARRGGRRPLALMGVVAIGILANAFVSASISEVNTRFQTRVAWLVPLAAAAALAWLARGSGSRAAREPTPPSA